jgi:hypothetical protein
MSSRSGSVPSACDPEVPLIYEIRIQGHLEQDWTGWFEGLTITLADTGETVLTGPVVDQAALFRVLRKVRDIGLPLLSVVCLSSGQVDAPEVEG